LKETKQNRALQLYVSVNHFKLATYYIILTYRKHVGYLNIFWIINILPRTSLKMLSVGSRPAGLSGSTPVSHQLPEGTFKPFPTGKLNICRIFFFTSYTVAGSDTVEDAKDNNSHTAHNRNKLQIHTSIQWSTQKYRYQNISNHTQNNKIHAAYSRKVKAQIYTGDYDKGYQQMSLSFVLFLYLHVSSLHVSGFYQPIIRAIPSCCLFVTTWFL